MSDGMCLSLSKTGLLWRIVAGGEGAGVEGVGGFSFLHVRSTPFRIKKRFSHCPGLRRGVETLEDGS